jgi:hypothetical protein
MLRFSKEIFWYQHQQFKENNENDMAAQVFWTAFLFQPMAEPNWPKS